MDMSNHSNNPDENEEYCAPFHSVCTFLDEKEIKYAKHPKKKLISLTMVGDHVVKRCTLRITHNGSLLQLFIGYPVYAKPEQVRASVAEFLTRANYGLSLGAFEMDLNDGEIRFHASQIIHEGDLPGKVFGRFFFSSLQTTERYFPALMQLLFGGLTAADAIYLAEIDSAVESLENETTEKKPAPPQSDIKPKPRTKPRKKPPEQPAIDPPQSRVTPDPGAEDTDEQD